MSENRPPDASDPRNQLFRLREDLSPALRQAARRSGGGFAGISLMSAAQIARYMAGNGPFADPEGPGLAQKIERFDEICRVTEVNTPPEEQIHQGQLLGESIIRTLEEWLAEHSQSE